MNEAASCPPEVLDLLPWYADDGLTPEERGQVEAHAAGCAGCRRELLDAFRDVALPADAPSPERVLARVFDAIAARAGGEASSPAPGAPDAMPAAAGRAAAPAAAAPDPRGATPRPGRAAPLRRARALARPSRAAAAAAAAFVLGAVGGAALPRLTGAPAPVYQTAAAPQVAAPGDGPRLDVVLREDVSVAELRRTLGALGAEVVGGPSAVGRYRLRLPAGADATAVAAALRAEGTGIATFAEPAL